MNSKVKDHHLSKPAYIYIRQSTMGQVRHHQESTERQYALKDKAIELSWSASMTRILDRDLGLSGAQSQGREDFKILVADVSMGKVGAVFALEASRLARSCADWHRLLELCSLTDTLIIDEDGCYDLTDFNDQLLLGLKGTMSQAELHVLRARLQGGKLNKAKKGELRFPLPVGLCYDEDNRIVLDPDEEVRGVVELVFSAFRETGSAYGVIRRFTALHLRFPKRTYGGAWNGKLIWGRLTHARVLNILKNPAYAGTYVFGRYRRTKKISSDGHICTETKRMPMASWMVTLESHHEGYISWEEYLKNQEILQQNRTNGEETLLSGAAREGLALLQGLLLCGRCGRRLTVRYKGNGGIYPTYDCNWLRRDGFASTSCMSIRCDLLDNVVAKRLLEILTNDQIEIALKALEELEKRDATVSRQWQMRIQRAEYEAELAQRRYEEVDPSNRLVAATLEKRWNEALLQLERVKEDHAEFTNHNRLILTPDQRNRILALAQDFPRLWKARTTRARDRKRMLRLLIEDITVEKVPEAKRVLLRIRWQGGACEDIFVQLPLPINDRIRYPKEMVDKVRELAKDLPDDQIAERFNREGLLSAKEKSFTVSMIRWIRHRHKIPGPSKRPDEFTVNELMEKLGVSRHVVYYWIERGHVTARRTNQGSPYWITLDAQKEKELLESVRNSSRIQKSHSRFQTLAVGGAV